MSVLVWKRAADDAQLLAHFSVPRGKLLQMEGRGYTEELPKEFQLLRVDSPFLAMCKRRLDRETETVVRGGAYVAQCVDAHTVRTDPFPLSPRSRFSAHRWNFTDGQTKAYTIRTVRWADIRLLPTIGAPPGSPFEANLRVETAVPLGLDDPPVTLSPVLPWSTRAQELTVRDVLEDELAEDEENGRTSYPKLYEVASEYLDENVREWEFSIEPGAMDLVPGQRAISEIHITAHSPGAVALAISAVAGDSPDDPIVSEVVAVEIGPDKPPALLCADGHQPD